MKTAPIKTGQVTNNYAWILAKRLHKRPPYRGYALALANGFVLVHTPDGRFLVHPID